MKSAFDVITRHFAPKQDIKIYLIADLHAGALEFLSGEWHKFREKVLNDPNAYIIIAGDMINNATRSSISNVFDEVMRPREQKRWLADQLADFAEMDKILCATDGNHERRGERDADDNPMYDVMAKLDCEDIYRPDMAFLKLQFGSVNGNGLLNPTYTLAVTHGSGGGAQTGSSVNKAEKAAAYFEGIDVMVTAHTHKGHVSKPAKYVFDKHNNRISRSYTVVVGCVSWLEWAGYAMRKLLPPAHIADPQQLLLCGSRKEIRTVW